MKIAKQLDILGSITSDIGETEKAIEYYEDALKRKREIKTRFPFVSIKELEFSIIYSMGNIC